MKSRSAAGTVGCGVLFALRAAAKWGSAVAGIMGHREMLRRGCARLYPKEIHAEYFFKDGGVCRFRPIKPSDEEGMRRLFYRFSNEAVYSRYFIRVRSMPHKKMQAYVNVDWRQVMSIVGLVGLEGSGTIVAEARFIRIPGTVMAELEFIVDEAYQGLGIATFLYKMLIRLARERGLKKFPRISLHTITGDYSGSKN